MIRIPEIRVIGADGKMIGIVKTAKAMQMAEEEGLDLVEVAPNAKPPTCKIMDYGKYLYEQKKKAQESKKKQSVVSIKELQVRPRTDVHDRNVKIKKARKFILEGDKVRFNMRFRGREMAHQQLGRELLLSMVEEIKDICQVEAAPKMEGHQLYVILAPDKVKIEAYEKEAKNSDAEA